MGFFKKMKEMVGIEEIEDDFELEEEVQASPAADRKPADSRPIKPSPIYAETAARMEARRSATATGAKLTDQFKMVVNEPSGYDDSSRLVDNLKARKPVIVNLENLDEKTARRIFDFLCGATYALNGGVQKVSNSIYLFSPESVDVSSNVDKRTGVGTETKSPWRSRDGGI